jgi:hypothetical protein
MDPSRPLEYTDALNHDAVYLATICGSATILEPACKASHLTRRTLPDRSPQIWECV